VQAHNKAAMSTEAFEVNENEPLIMPSQENKAPDGGASQAFDANEGTCVRLRRKMGRRISQLPPENTVRQ
jgi:hypothetical protein